jgi:hypothetical protein
VDSPANFQYRHALKSEQKPSTWIILRYPKIPKVRICEAGDEICKSVTEPMSLEGITLGLFGHCMRARKNLDFKDLDSEMPSFRYILQHAEANFFFGNDRL